MGSGSKQLGELLCRGITRRFQLFESIQRAFITAQFRQQSVQLFGGSTGELRRSFIGG